MPALEIPEFESEEGIAYLSRILAKNDISDDIKKATSSKSFGEGGEGDPGKVSLGDGKEFLKIEFEDKAPLELFLKKLPKSEELFKIYKDGKYMEKESFFYNTFLPDAIAFQEKRDRFQEMNLRVMFPKCYHADENMILLENVTKRGFTLTPVIRPHTFYQAQTILENLGTFHAVTYSMIKELGVEEFKNKYTLIAEENTFVPEKIKEQSTEWERCIEMALAVLKSKPKDGLEQVASKFLEKYQGKVFQELCDQVKSRNEDLLTTVNFGDLWSGNVFVVRNEEKKLYPAAIFIDMKMTRIGSPMLDVGSYIFSCLADHVRATNWKYMLDCFLEHIREGSKAMDQEFKFKFDDFKVLYIGKSLHGIFRALDHLMTKFYLRHLYKRGEAFEMDKFEKWLSDCPEIPEALSTEIVSKIQQYEGYLKLLTD